MRTAVFEQDVEVEVYKTNNAKQYPGYIAKQHQHDYPKIASVVFHIFNEGLQSFVDVHVHWIKAYQFWVTNGQPSVTGVQVEGWACVSNASWTAEVKPGPYDATCPYDHWWINVGASGSRALSYRVTSKETA